MGKVFDIKKQYDLVRAVQQNDQTVLKQLYQNNYKKIEIYILKNNGSIPQAKDHYQDAFIVMYQNIKANRFVPQNETALEGYLYQIAKNKWLDYLRSSQYKKTGGISEKVFATMTETYEHEVYDEKAQDIQLIMEAYAKLGKECRELLSLYYFKKKSMREIAAELDLAEASTRNKKYRCIQKLRALTVTPN